MRPGLFIALIAAGVTGHVAAAQQAPAPRAEILVLGTYHMANPGRDIFNTQADDVLAAKRQKEIATDKTDLVAAGFKRNMRIYTNIVRLVDSPGERVLVIYGAGHLGWLQYAIRNSPNLRLRTLAEIAR